MLILSRKIGEAVVVNDNVRLTVVEITGGRVRLAFEAPREVPIHRAEVQVEIQEQRAAQAA